ncbi:hypothetical protein TKK_0012993 [Trichogramma kaykai]
MISCPMRRKFVMILMLPLMNYCCLMYLELPDYLATILQLVWHAASQFFFFFGLHREDQLTSFLKRMGCTSLEEKRRFFLGVHVYWAVSLWRPHYLTSRR